MLRRQLSHGKRRPPPLPPPDPPKPPDGPIELSVHDKAILDRSGYQITTLIGEGTFGKVYKAFQIREPTNIVAIKHIKTQADNSTYTIKFLPRELELIQKMHHPNIINVNLVVNERPDIFIFMEYAAHGTVFDIMNGEPLTENKTREITRGIVNAVFYLHTNGIAHRDLKLTNILLTEDDLVKLTDFGFAIEIKPGELSSTWVGSSGYFPPEILERVEYDSKKVDMWCLGICVFHMLNGRPPFPSTEVWTLK